MRIEINFNILLYIVCTTIFQVMEDVYTSIFRLARLRHFIPNYMLSYAEQLNNLGCCVSVGSDAITKYILQKDTILSLILRKIITDIFYEINYCSLITFTGYFLLVWFWV